MSNSRPASKSDLPAQFPEIKPLTTILSNAQAAHRCPADTMLDRAELHDILDDIIAADKPAAAIIKRLTEALNEERAQMGEAMEEGLPL